MSKAQSPEERFKSYPVGFFHIDIAEVHTAEGKLYLYVAIDRTSKLAEFALAETEGFEPSIGLYNPITV